MAQTFEMFDPQKSRAPSIQLPKSIRVFPRGFGTKVGSSSLGGGGGGGGGAGTSEKIWHVRDDFRTDSRDNWVYP